MSIELARESGAAAALGQETNDEAQGSGGDVCASLSAGEAADAPLPLVAGTQTQILPDGLAAAGQDAPKQVKEMVAAGNRLYGTSYLYGGGHG
ncbi:MAG: hypothetical protein ACYCYN_06605 [Solirubrobacteraceae bacterium]